MALTDEKKIQGLRELYKRGEPGERENAKRILEKNGIPLEAPATKPPPQTRDMYEDLRRASERMSEAMKGRGADFDDDFADMLRGYNRSYRQPPPPPPPRRRRIHGVETEVEAAIIGAIARRLYKTKGAGVWDRNDEAFVFNDTTLTEEQVEEVSSLYNFNYKRMREVAVEAIKDVLSKTPVYRPKQNAS